MQIPLIILSSILITLSFASALLAGGVNTANLVLTKCLAKIELISPQFGYFGGVNLSDGCTLPWPLTSSIEWLERLFPNYTQVRQQQVKFGLIFSDWPEQVTTFDFKNLDDPFVLLGEMAFESRQGNHQRVIELASSQRIGFGFVEPIIQDLVALANNNIAIESIRAGDWAIAITSLEKAIEQRPNDLLTLYLMQQVAEKSVNASLIASTQQRLTQIGISSFKFSDSRVADTTAQAIVQLMNENLWDAPTAYSKIASIVWQFPDSRTNAILDALLRLEPNRPEWLIFADELAQRRADPNQLNTISDDSSFPCMPAQTLDVMTSQSIAKVLNTDPASIDTGTNLLPIHFADTVITTNDRQILFWYPTGMAGIQGYDTGEFYSGLDDLCQEHAYFSGRLNVMWTGNHEGTPRPWAGWWIWNASTQGNYLLHVDKESLYAFMFVYKTQWVTNHDFSVWLNSETTASSKLAGEHSFPGTDGHWRMGVILGYGDELPISPLFRLAGQGHVWIDYVQLRQIKTVVPQQYDFPIRSSVQIDSKR